jgi:hypothetical protein
MQLLLPSLATLIATVTALQISVWPGTCANRGKFLGRMNANPFPTKVELYPCYYIPDQPGHAIMFEYKPTGPFNCQIIGYNDGGCLEQNSFIEISSEEVGGCVDNKDVAIWGYQVACAPL